ncbi:toll-Interleukin receptor, partial [Vibrio navarrensis]|uniref:STAND family AAA ATPase n=1 Tax=Vibrio navarrensis TaxID=29495 RepID=UPI001D04D030
VVLLDNIDDIGLNTKFTRVFLERINSMCNVSYITCHSSYRYVYGDIPALDEYERVEMLGLGNKKREEIVQKWISLGIEESIDDYDLYSECDELKSRLNAVIKKNIVPPKPIYVLMLLQMFEAHVQLKMDMTSYGHCYQQLIYQSFDNASIPKNEFDRYLNVLTEFSWLIFKNKKEPNQNEVDDFFYSYNKKYLPVDDKTVLNKLTKHSILNFNGISYSFKYPYIYYFFVGKKVAESYRDSEDTKGMVAHLLSELHREDYANILIFITHHTKDSWVLDEINKVLSSLFDEHSEATLNKKQLAFMDDFMKEIPELILEQREIQKERDRQNERLDHFERRSEVDESKDNTIEQSEPLDILANINKTFKGMEISGQIIRNRHASLTRDSMEELARTGACSGLRFLEYFIKISDVAKNEIIKLISNHLAEYPDISDKEIEKQAENTYLHLTYGVISGLTRKIASSIGSKEALEVYTEMEANIGTPAISLIRQAIELQFNKSLDVDQISDCVKQLRGNPVCLRILKEMVIQHIYMFPVPYRQKQQLSTLLNLTVQGQRLMDMNKTGKG